MTEPLVPVDVDLRDFPYTPILRGRLFGSSFHAKATDGEWRAGMTLWLKTWEQVPAGSLPTDETEQCRLAELGRDLRTWRKVRARALHGWAIATDGLMDHRIVAEVVLEAWIEKLGQQLSGGAGNAKRWGFAFDAAGIQAQIGVATGMLFALNPQSRTLRKKRHSGIPSGLPPAIPPGQQTDPDGTPARIAIEVKRSGTEGIEDRDVGVTPTVEATGAAPTKVNGAIEKTRNSTQKVNGSGQQWGDPAWVSATANTLGITRRAHEDDAGWKDRVYATVAAKRVQDAAKANERQQR